MNNWEKLIVQPGMSILQAMKAIDQAATRFVIVMDDSGKLLGVVTDGDVRRGILKNIPLTEPVERIMNAHPYCLPDGVSRAEARRLLDEKQITHVPTVDSRGKVTGVISNVDRPETTVCPYTAVLMVGGLGTRLGELTSECPKPMLPVSGRPVLETIVRNLREHGFRDFVFCVNYRADVIKSHFGDGEALGVRIRYVHETKRMGTAGALGLLPEDVQGPLLVMNGDIVTNVNFTRLLDFHQEHRSCATMGVRNYDFQVPFGVIKTSEGRITGIEEKPVYNFMVSAGIYVLEKKWLSSVEPGAFFDMPQLFEKIGEGGGATHVFPIHEYWLDIGSEGDLKRAHEEFPQWDRWKE